MRALHTMVPMGAVLISLSACGGGGSPEVATDYLPPGLVDEVYSAPLVAFGGEAPLRWSLVEGSSLPEGLTLNPAGAISGVPGTPVDGIIQVQVQDARGRTADASLELDIAYDADVLLCDGVVSGELTEPGLVDFDLDPTVDNGIAWVSVALPPEDITRIDIAVTLDGFGPYGYVYYGVPGTEPGDTDLDHYVDYEFIQAGSVARIDLGTIADLELYRAQGDPITLMFGTAEPTAWSLTSTCSAGPIFTDLKHDPTRVGEVVLTNYNVYDDNQGVRIWTDDALPQWLTWDESNGRLGGTAEEAGVWPITIHAQAGDGPVRSEQTWISTWEPTPISCGESVELTTEEGYYQGELSSWLDPRGYTVFTTDAPEGVSRVVAQLEGPNRSYVGWSDPRSPYYTGRQVASVSGTATTAYSPASWPPIGDAIALGEPLYGVAYNQDAAADLRLQITCDTAPRLDAGTLPVIHDAARFELPAIGGVGALTWGAEDLPDGVDLSADGTLSADTPVPGAYPVTLAIEDETGQLSESDFDLHVGWASACGERERIACGDRVRGTFTGTLFDREGEYEDRLCLVHELDETARIGLTVSTGEDAQVGAFVLTPTERDTADVAFSTDQQSRVLFVGAGAATPLDPWLDRILPVDVRAYRAGDWSLEVLCD